MRNRWLIPTLVVTLSGIALAQPAPAPAPFDAAGYVDADQNGINDRFCDAQGDGVNDVTGKAYAHYFGYTDRDGDGINDLFRDVDGDGVNDLDARVEHRDGDGRCVNVVDGDGDGRNDVTGEAYGTDLGGWRHGLVDEERGARVAELIDVDADGADDRWETGRGRGHVGVDVFVDEDGDGIADGRLVCGRQKAGGVGRPEDTGRPGVEPAQGDMGRDDESPGHSGPRGPRSSGHH
jgi:hypothetical protein